MNSLKDRWFSFHLSASLSSARSGMLSGLSHVCWMSEQTGKKRGDPCYVVGLDGC